VLGGTSAFLALVLYWPAAQRLFHFAHLDGPDLLLACSAGVASILWFEALKVFRRRHQ
jgi:Ca2+-transporting ATPase